MQSLLGRLIQGHLLLRQSHHLFHGFAKGGWRGRLADIVDTLTQLQHRLVQVADGFAAFDGSSSRLQLTETPRRLLHSYQGVADRCCQAGIEGECLAADLGDLFDDEFDAPCQCLLS